MDAAGVQRFAFAKNRNGKVHGAYATQISVYKGLKNMSGFARVLPIVTLSGRGKGVLEREKRYS